MDDLQEAVFPLFSRDDFSDQSRGRVYQRYEQFEAIFDRDLGDRVRANGACGVDLWCALMKFDWCGPNGEIVSYGVRRAGDIVAWVRE